MAADPAPAPASQDLRDLRERFRSEHDDGASSNDIVQMLDDFLTEHGLDTVLYRG